MPGLLTSSDLPAPTARPRAPLRRTLIIAAAIYAFDGLFAGQGVLAVLTFVGSLGVGLIMLLLAVYRRHPGRLRLRAARVGIYFLMATATLATISVNNRIAAHRAERLIDACRQYDAKYHHLPARLDDLVPEFVPHIPRAKYTAANAHFSYSGYRPGEASPSLYYVSLPPFGRRIYWFDRGRWSFMG